MPSVLKNRLVTKLKKNGARISKLIYIYIYPWHLFLSIKLNELLKKLLGLYNQLAERLTNKLRFSTQKLSSMYT